MKIHIVQKGDTLWEIAKQYGVDFEELKQFNSHIASPDMIMPGMKIKIPSSSKSVKQASETKAVKTKVAEKQVKTEATKIKPKEVEKAMPHMPEVPQMPVLGGDFKIESPKKYTKSPTDLQGKEMPKTEQFKEQEVKPVHEHSGSYTHPIMPVMPMCCCQHACPCCSQVKQNQMHNMGHMKGPCMQQNNHIMHPGKQFLPPEATGQKPQQWQGYPEQLPPQYTDGNMQHYNAFDQRFANEPITNMYQRNPAHVPMYHQPINHAHPIPPGFIPTKTFDDQKENK